MDCVVCGSVAVTERPERTARGYRRFRCRECGKQYNERSGGLLNHTHYPSDVIALVVLWRLQGDDWERLASRGPRWLRWLRTHPTLEERMAALRGMATPARAALSDPDRVVPAPRELWALGGHHPAQRLARRWLL